MSNIKLASLVATAAKEIRETMEGSKYRSKADEADMIRESAISIADDTGGNWEDIAHRLTVAVTGFDPAK